MVNPCETLLRQQEPSLVFISLNPKLAQVFSRNSTRPDRSWAFELCGFLVQVTFS